jgi:hypothetical protein
MRSDFSIGGGGPISSIVGRGRKEETTAVGSVSQLFLVLVFPTQVHRGVAGGRSDREIRFVQQTDGDRTKANRARRQTTTKATLAKHTATSGLESTPHAPLSPSLQICSLAHTAATQQGNTPQSQQSSHCETTRAMMISAAGGNGKTSAHAGGEETKTTVPPRQTPCFG